MDDKRIVITGIGVIAPNGIGKEKFWDALKDGRSGIKPISRFDTTEFKCKLAGEVSDFKPADYLGEKGLRELDRSSRFLCTAAKLAINDAKLSISEDNTDAIGVCTGTTLSSLWNIAEYDREVIKDGPLFTDAGVFAGTVANAASSRVSILFNIQGFNATISTGYTSSIEAIRYAANFIQSGRVKVVLAGGVESISPASFTGFYRLGFLAGLKGEELSCPFDKRRNGIIIGEGAGVIVLEDETYAKERKAHIYAEVKGAASSFDAYKLGKYQPQGKGLLQSIRKTLSHSRIRPEQIDCVQASANSVKEHDRIETGVLRGVFAKQADKIPVTAVKSMLGESFSAAGLFQVISALGSIKEGFVPAVANYREKDPDCDLHYVTNTLRSRKVSNVLISSFGPGGNNCALLLSKYL